MLRDYLEKYPVSLDSKTTVKYFQNLKKNAIKVGGTQIDRNVALCLTWTVFILAAAHVFRSIVI